jgi:hypothetical protein
LVEIKIKQEPMDVGYLPSSSDPIHVPGDEGVPADVAIDSPKTPLADEEPMEEKVTPEEDSGRRRSSRSKATPSRRSTRSKR